VKAKVICAYCGQEAKGTKEHIISCAILDLFPEYFATIDSIRGRGHLGDSMLKDVVRNVTTKELKSQQYLKEIETRWQKEEEDLAKRFPR